MSVSKRTAGRWAGRLVVAGVAIVAGCSAGRSTSPSTEPVQNGAHPTQVTLAVSPPSTPMPTRSTPSTRSSTVPPTTTTPPPEPVATPSTSPPTTLVRRVTTTTSAAPTPDPAAPQPALGNPSASMPPDPDFLSVCSPSSVDLTGPCEDEALQAIDHARASERLGPMDLPSDWSALTPAEQLFVATNLERTARGMAPFDGIATALEPAAQGAADSGSDPVPPAGFPTSYWTSDSGEGLSSPLGALYFWMYDDGTNSPNVNCRPGDTGGCWDHRENILTAFPCTPCVVGSAASSSASWAELMAETTGAPELSFSWSSVH